MMIITFIIIINIIFIIHNDPNLAVVNEIEACILQTNSFKWY